MTEPTLNQAAGDYLPGPELLSMLDLEDSLKTSQRLGSLMTATSFEKFADGYASGHPDFPAEVYGAD